MLFSRQPLLKARSGGSCCTHAPQLPLRILCASHRQRGEASSKPQDPQQQQHLLHAAASALGQPPQQQQLRAAVVATAVCCAFVSNVGAARAASETWMPRRHHRHIGERFTDTWADSIVEVEHATTTRVRDLEKQLEQERKRADSESSRRRELEQQLKLVKLQQKAARPPADDGLLAIKVLGADITGPLVFLLLGLGAYWGYTRGGGKGGRQATGRWVFDRSLGGKKVWVPFATEGPGGGGASGELPDRMSDDAFEALASKAASLAASQRQKRQQPYAPPSWWQPPMSFAASEAGKAAAQLQASAIMARLEQAKNRGEDYKLSEIAALRQTCQAGGGVTVDARTVGGRDAIYKAAVDAAVRSCIEPGSVDQSDLGDNPPVAFIAGVAQDVQIPDERAVGMAVNWVAGTCRSRIVEAYTAAKKGDDVASTQCLFQLANLLVQLPVLEPGSPQLPLIAEELATWTDRDVLLRLREVLLQLLEAPEQQAVVNGMLGLA